MIITLMQLSAQVRSPRVIGTSVFMMYFVVHLFSVCKPSSGLRATVSQSLIWNLCTAAWQHELAKTKHSHDVIPITLPRAQGIQGKQYSK